MVENPFSNPNLTIIVNQTGKPFDWNSIINEDPSSSHNFVTGTVVNTYGNVEITAFS